MSERLQDVGRVVASAPAARGFHRGKLGFWEEGWGGPPANPGEIRWIILMVLRSKAGFRGDFIEFMIHAAGPPERRQHPCVAVRDIAAGGRLTNVRDPNRPRMAFWGAKA